MRTQRSGLLRVVLVDLEAAERTGSGDDAQQTRQAVAVHVVAEEGAEASPLADVALLEVAVAPAEVDADAPAPAGGGDVAAPVGVEVGHEQVAAHGHGPGGDPAAGDEQQLALAV